MWRDSFGGNGYVEAVSDRDRSPRTGCRHPVRQVPYHAPSGRGSGPSAQERIRPSDGPQTPLHQRTEIHPVVQSTESHSGWSSRAQGAFASQPAPARGLPAQGVVRTTLELPTGRLGSPILPELEKRPQMATTQTLREVRPHDRNALGGHRRLLPAGEQSVSGLCRGTQQQDPGHSTTSLWSARRGVSASESSDLHVASHLSGGVLGMGSWGTLSPKPPGIFRIPVDPAGSRPGRLAPPKPAVFESTAALGLLPSRALPSGWTPQSLSLHPSLPIPVSSLVDAASESLTLPEPSVDPAPCSSFESHSHENPQNPPTRFGEEAQFITPLPF